MRRIPAKRPSRSSSPSKPSSLPEARRFADLGFTVLAVKPRSKHLFAGRTPSTPPTDAELAAKWEQYEKDVPLNIGIKTGARHRVIAIDIDSPAGLAVAELAFPEPSCRTARGVPGKQRWLYAPPDEAPVPTVRKWRGHDIDILGDGGYFVAPGSTLDDSDVIEEIGPNGGPWTLDALARLPRFDRAWLEADDDGDVVLMSRYRGGLPDQWQLMQASARLFARVKHRGDRITFRCPFHDDTDPSAVLFKEGWLHCAACGVSEPAQRWTKRPEVAHASLDRLVIPIAVTKPTSDEAQFRVPRLLIEVSAHLHGDAAGSHARNLVQRGDGHVDGPALLSEGELAVLWAIIASARALEEYAGGIPFARAELADALGWLSSSTRAGVDKAVKKLSSVRVRLRPFAKEAASIGPLVELRTGRLFLHPALVAALNARGKQWAAVPRAVLRFTHRARMVSADAIRCALDDPQPAPLQQLARRCGVWNPERVWKQRGAYLRAWQDELPDGNAVAHLDRTHRDWLVVPGPGRIPPSAGGVLSVSPLLGGAPSGISPSAGDAVPVRMAVVDSSSACDSGKGTVLDDDRDSPSAGDAQSSGGGDPCARSPQEINELAECARDQGKAPPAGDPPTASASAARAETRSTRVQLLIPQDGIKRMAIGTDKDCIEDAERTDLGSVPLAVAGASLRRPYKRPR